MSNKRIDPARLFAEAQRIFVNGDGAGAVILLDRLPATAASDGQVLHFRALALKKAGQLEEAKDAFVRARRASPHDAQVVNNYANLLLQMGITEAAVGLYDEALNLQPDFADAQLNRALANQYLGKFDEALAGVDALISTGRANARVFSVRGTIMLALNRLDEAAVCFDRSLALGPQLPVALHGRAKVALERGETSASARFKIAQTAMPHEAEVLLGLAEAFEAEGNPEGITLLTKAVAERPDWVFGLERLARMRAEAGDEYFEDHYRHAIKLADNPQPLALSLAKVLADADRYADALDVLAPLPEDRALTLLRAFYLGEAGDPEAGLAMLEESPHPDDGETLMVSGRLAMALGDLDRALFLLDRAVIAAPEAVSVWAHCELAWRATNDARADWLSGQDGLVATRTLNLDSLEIDAVVEILRSLHRTHAHPIGQSLRHGTQTRGRLFRRQEPEIRRLKEAVEAATADYVSSLPSSDPRHPLLKHRDSPLTIAGSWSVKLTGSGFHVQHIHSEGLISSACYLALPRGVCESATHDGWLELGRPPSALNLTLDPVAELEPAVGRLAMFPSYLYHGTLPFEKGERLTVAFDVVLA